MKTKKQNIENIQTSDENDFLNLVILEVLKSWETQTHGYFDSIWYGYQALLDQVREKNIKHDLKDLKKAMKKLRAKGFVELKPIYDDELIMCGSGYFIETTYNVILP